MARKIIQILCHTLYNDKYLEYHINGNWSTRLSKSLLDYSDKFDYEVWYTILELKKKRVFTKKGITYKLFPAWTLNKTLESFFGIVFSPSLLSELGHEDPNSTIIHFQGERGLLIHSIIRKFPKFSFTLQYHGYGQSSWFDWMEKLFILPIDRINFPLISHFFVHIKRRINYLINGVGIDPKRVSFQNVGVDFGRFRPRDKVAARNKLNLPDDKFIILYVGHMIKAKGVDKIIKAYQILKKSYPQLYLLIVGAEKVDPMYEKAKHMVDKIIEFIKNDELPFFYNAADVYCFLGNKKTVEYAGVGTAPTEALASNLNVISTNLFHIPYPKGTKIGFLPKNFDDFLSQLRYLIKNSNFKFNAREEVAPYVASQYMIRNLLSIYEKLLSQKN